MHQFFVDSSQIGLEQITITGRDVNHICNVLRMKEGTTIRISDKEGHDYFCSIAQCMPDMVLADIINQDERGTELPAKIYLFQALPKGDRMETVIEKAVELGVYEIIPVAMKYCVVKLDAKKAAAKVVKWQAQAETAAKQSKRSVIPHVHEVVTYKEALALTSACDIRLVPYENEAGMKGTKQALEQIEPGKSISILIGPEGGFSKEEIQAARENMQSVSLGKRILRTDTAGICMMSMLMLQLETVCDTTEEQRK